MSNIDSEKLIKFKEALADIIVSSQGICTYQDCKDIAEREASSLIGILQQEQPKSKFVKVRCVFPFDKTWEKDKIYTCKVWHHGDLNRNFFDVYYDYEKDPKYVQFPTIELLNEEFAIIQEESKVIPEQQEADLEKFISDFLDKKDTENNGRWSEDDIVEAMTQAFELGLNARK